MKKGLLILTCLFAPFVNATGIPVVDGANLAQMAADNISKAAQWAKEAKQWAKANGFDVEQIEEAKRQGEHYARMVEGHYSFEDVLNDPLLNGVMDMSGWRALYDTIDDVAKLREEFGIKQDDDRFDDAIKKYKLLDRFYERTIDRGETLERLLEQFSKAENPAAKADLANAIALEQTKIANDKQILNSLQGIADQQSDIRHSAESRKKIDTLFGEGIPRS